ncbi:MAG: glycine--tRNA ligase subunit beta [Streptococcaceae bacterium]|jgi:glycyl-tRNA synthetase beta chain|nr:glycine--tRNA ligase subunit beta [Streptococcaceae bacterium]
MAKDLLLEIGLEEMPAHVVTPSMNQLVQKTQKFLKENRLDFERVEGLSTPRRLAVKVYGLAEKQADTKEEFKGPAKKIAMDEAGNWSKAAIGFVKGKGLDVSDITFKEIKGVEYVHVTKAEQGKLASEILVHLNSVIESLTFPVSMRWADFDYDYIRPVHWIVALLDEEIIPFTALNVATGRTSRPHRLAKGTPTFTSPKNYEEELKAYQVIVNPDARKKMIVEQMKTLASEHSWHLEIDEKLLEEVNNLVEFPTVFAGKYDEKYLELPSEVLVTSMKEHQRFFEVYDENKQLSPHFISVRNGGVEFIENVIAGNEKVLVARLEDGEFFWNEDKHLKINDLVEKLSKVTFHEKIGTLTQHMKRTGAIAQILADLVGLTGTQKEDLKRAASIYKFDLVTNMVGEFPELQGVMGEKYALLQGETISVAQAIREHYLPISAEGELPVSKVGAVLAIADKLDSLYSFFSVDLIPSGSNDPYALRRFVQGVIRIMEAFGWDIDFALLQEQIYTHINENIDEYSITFSHDRQALEFVKARIRQLLSSKIKRHDILDAAVKANQSRITEIFAAAQVLDTHANDETFRDIIESLTRVVNLAKKATVALDVNTTLFENEHEEKLHEKIVELAQNYDVSASERFELLSSLAPLIVNYFDNTMVMTDDEKVKNNRLSELKRLATMITSFAAVDELIVK